MRTLKATFRLDGFEFKLLKRNGLVALFEKSKDEHTHPSFEVVILQVYPATKLWGVEQPERETMPHNEQWGKAGWTFQEREAAEKQYRELLQE